VSYLVAIVSLDDDFHAESVIPLGRSSVCSRADAVCAHVSKKRSKRLQLSPQVSSSRLPQAGETAADPAYPGAHSTISAGGAFELRALFSDKPYQLNVTSEVLPGVVRSFDSFAAVEKEASLSRIYAGQHFRSDENAGERLGTAVADFLVDNFLSPVHRRSDGDRDGDGY
jgi:hypothetical protein